MAPHLTPAERASLDEEVRKAEQRCRAEFSVFVGQSGAEPRAHAVALHHALVAPERSILIMVDPAQRAVEIVSGAWVRRSLSDAEAALAVEAMTSCFADGDLAEGLRRGIRLLGEHAQQPRTLHAQA